MSRYAIRVQGMIQLKRRPGRTLNEENVHVKLLAQRIEKFNNRLGPPALNATDHTALPDLHLPSPSINGGILRRLDLRDRHHRRLHAHVGAHHRHAHHRHSHLWYTESSRHRVREHGLLIEHLLMLLLMLVLGREHDSVSLLLLCLNRREVFLSQRDIVIVIAHLATGPRLQVHHGHATDRKGHVVVFFVLVVCRSRHRLYGGKNRWFALCLNM
jgi:hypothetical protein